MPKSPTTKLSYLARVRAAAEQLHALATAKTDAYRQAQLSSIDWALVADEFDSVVAKYENSVERYASRVIQGLQSITISYKASVEMELAMADLELHLVYFELADVDRAIAATWGDMRDEWAEARGLLVQIGQITSLSALRTAFEEKQARHRKLNRFSIAYRDGWPVSNTSKGVKAVLSVSKLSRQKKVDALLIHCKQDWQSTSSVLKQTLQALGIPETLSALAELAFELPVSVLEDVIELKGTAAMWQDSEIRRI